MNCGRVQTVMNRREMLSRCANGFGALALSPDWRVNCSGGPHFRAKAKSVIFLYMDGGPSQLDTFDPKPLLANIMAGTRTSFCKSSRRNSTMSAKCWLAVEVRAITASAGCWSATCCRTSPQCADDLCVVRSLTSKFSEHTSANYFLHTGHGIAGRPSMGAWFSYGLGSENRNLPGFVVLNGGLIPVGGLDNFGSGFLPAAYQGSIFTVVAAGGEHLADWKRRKPSRKAKLDLINKLDRRVTERGQRCRSSRPIANYETAFRMQAAVPELMDLTAKRRRRKRFTDSIPLTSQTRIYGTQCLLARRLVERGVRFVELTCPPVGGSDRWDQHGGLKDGHEKNCRAVDQPIAGLLKDLKSRGLLDSTLVVWAGEFGRTPFAQGTDGRDHNPFGFTVWLAGGGVKGAFALRRDATNGAITP